MTKTGTTSKMLKESIEASDLGSDASFNMQTAPKEKVIKVLVASHKDYPMPEDPIYVPIQVGAAGKESIKGFIRDDSGDNISGKNDRYCELTGLYYGWKNLECDYLGLMQYRRRFTLSGEEALSIFKEADIIVPKKRRYFIESLYSHYANTLEKGHLDIAKQVVSEKYPSYIPYLDDVYSRTWGYMFNMFIMDKERMDRYCEWLFTILEECERRIDISTLSAFDKRLFGRVSEVIFNAWVLKEWDEGAIIREVPVMSTEKVNWLKKGSAFLMAKFFHKKYDKSF